MIYSYFILRMPWYSSASPGCFHAAVSRYAGGSPMMGKERGPGRRQPLSSPAPGVQGLGSASTSRALPPPGPKRGRNQAQRPPPPPPSPLRRAPLGTARTHRRRPGPLRAPPRTSAAPPAPGAHRPFPSLPFPG